MSKKRAAAAAAAALASSGGRVRRSCRNNAKVKYTFDSDDDFEESESDDDDGNRCWESGRPLMVLSNGFASGKESHTSTADGYERRRWNRMLILAV